MADYNHEVPIIRNGDEIVLDVEFNYSPGRPMTMYRRNGDPGDPAEPDELELINVRAKGETEEFKLTEDEENAVIEKLMDSYDFWFDFGPDDDYDPREDMD